MRNPNTISNTIDSVKRAAIALGVSPYGDDGLTFTRREFEIETKGAHVFDSLETLRDRHAVVVDHSKTFIHPSTLTVSIACVYKDVKRLKLTAHVGYITVVIKYTPEFEGVRYFYRFDLRGYLRRQQIHINNTITECEEQAAKYQALADAKTAQAAKLRKLMANLDKL